MRRFGLILCFLGGTMVVLAAAGCGESAPTTSNTAPSQKQAMKEGKSGGVPGGPVGQGKGEM